MKNREKYAEELLDVVCAGKNIAINKQTMQIRSCEGLSCEHCLLDGDDCDTNLAEWAESEYVEPAKISKKDRAFLDYIKGYEYMTRDDDGKIYVYISTPIKRLACACWGTDGAYKSLRGLDIDFPMVKWSDAEPWLIEDLKELEVVDEYEYSNEM